MESRDDRREAQARPAAKVERFFLVTQCEPAGTGAQPEEQTRQLRSVAGGDDDVLAIAVQLHVEVRRADGRSGEGSARLVLKRELEQLHRRRGTLRRLQEHERQRARCRFHHGR